MTKLCSVCSTENRDEAQFCRACGTAFPTVQTAGTEDESLAAGVAHDVLLSLATRAAMDR